MTDQILIIGAGKVGRGLAQAFRATGTAVLGVHSRNPGVGATSNGSMEAALEGASGQANVIVVAVADPANEAVCRELLDVLLRRPGLAPRGMVVLTTSGVVTPQCFTGLRRSGIPCGTLHPLAPFATAERGAAAVVKGWFGIAGDEKARATGRRLAAALEARTIDIPGGQESAYHAAAVMASNFPVVLAALAVRVLRDAGVDSVRAAAVVSHLMGAAVANLAQGEPASVLTGPAARGDEAVIAAHELALAGSPEAASVYRTLTRAARDLAGRESAGGGRG